MKIPFRIVIAIMVIGTVTAYFGGKYDYWSPVWVLAPVITSIVAIGWGVVSMRVQMFVSAECNFEPDGNEVMLTFDDGPHPDKTPEILSLLEKYNAKGVFFCIGKYVDAYPETARQIVEKGHVIGSHSYFHGNLFDLLPPRKVAAELLQTEISIRNATGQDTRFFRPPYGITNPNIAKALRQFNYRVLGWNLRSYDTVIHHPEKLKNRVLRRIKPGSIILLHDTAPAILPVLENILGYLKENRYKTRLP